MAFSGEVRRVIYDKTNGRCHICHSRVALSNYGAVGERGAWEVEHSVPKSRGGTDHMNNLYPACVACNRDKSSSTTRTARRWNETTRAPFSKEKRLAMRRENTATGAVIGAICGVVGGPPGIALGALIGAAIGDEWGVPDA